MRIVHVNLEIDDIQKTIERLADEGMFTLHQARVMTALDDDCIHSALDEVRERFSAEVDHLVNQIEIETVHVLERRYASEDTL